MAGLYVVLSWGTYAQAQGDADPVPRPRKLRSDVVSSLASRSQRARARARAWAREQGVPVYRRLGDGTGMQLMDVQANRPVYFSTRNHNAAIASGAAVLYETLDYDLDGTGFSIGLWDQNVPLETHQEFQSPQPRITHRESMEHDEHATNVAGTLGAVGVKLEATGMAPGIRIDAYNWEDDLSEMASVAAAYPNEPNMLYVSNHSYGRASGWSYTNLSGTHGWHWLADWQGADSVEPAFGRYGGRAAILDAVAWNSPYFLAFIASGNDRNDNPNQGATVHYPTYPGGVQVWRKKKLDGQCPPGDGKVKNGYDTINTSACAKNVIAVGAVAQAVYGGVRELENTTVAIYSTFGPADDGRVKPDLVAQGNSMDTTSADTDRAYTRVTGTSFSCPSASGSAMLLVQLYDRLFEGQAMRASTLKGLLLHTADDLARPGPDYQSGWGLINVKAAAQLMRLHAHATPESHHMVELKLDASQSTQTFRVTLDEPEGVAITLCWTDPDAFPTNLHDRRQAALIHDLDLRVYRDNETYLPFTLDPLEPEKDAVPGDNVLDNVEQIVLNTSEPGRYTVEISRKRTLSTPEQWYSVISDVPLIVDTRLPAR